MNLEIETIRTIDLMNAFNNELLTALKERKLISARKTGALIEVIEGLALMCASVTDREKLIAIFTLKKENELLLKECNDLIVL